MSKREKNGPNVLWDMYGAAVTLSSTRVRVGVGVVIRDHQGWILLEKRTDSGLWGLPGGRIEAGESIREAASREVWEETGLAIRLRRLVGVYSEPGGRRIVTFPDNGDQVHLVDIIVEADIESGALMCSEESEALQFFPPDQLPSEIVPPAQAPIQDVLAGLLGRVR